MRSLLGALVLAGCTGSISDRADGPADGVDPTDPPPGTITDGEGGEVVLPESVAFDTTLADRCTPDIARGATHDGLRKLSKAELLRAVQRALEPADSYDVRILVEEQDFTYRPLADREPMQVALNQYPTDYARHRGEDFAPTYTLAQMQAWTEFVDELAIFFEEAELIGRFATECGEPSTGECRRALVESLGREAFRRPLDSGEVSELVALGTSTVSIVSAIFQSPQFMYVFDGGEDTGDPARVRLSSHEVASRLSFALTGAPPDDELRAAADAGVLSLDDVRLQASRILDTPEAEEQTLLFFSNWLRLHEVTNPSNPWANYARLGGEPPFDRLYNADGVGDQLVDEARDYARHVIWDRTGTFEDLFTLELAMPRSEKVRRIYETDGWSEDGAPQAAPNHPGLMTRAALLAGTGNNPNLIRRGVNVLFSFLCETITPPDFTIVATRTTELAVLDELTTPNHEMVATLTASSACIGCHQRINPVGFLFEAYNPVGQHDTVQRVLLNRFEFAGRGLPDPTYEEGVDYYELASFPLPPAPHRVSIDGVDRNVNDARELAAAIATSPQARACFALRLFRHLHRRPEREGDACAIADTVAALESGSILDALATAAANEDIFWRKR